MPGNSQCPLLCPHDFGQLPEHTCTHYTNSIQTPSDPNPITGITGITALTVMNMRFDYNTKTELTPVWYNFQIKLSWQKCVLLKRMV